MALIDNLIYKGSELRAISEYCLFEKEDDKLFLIPCNDIMRKMFRDFGFKEDEISAKEFCFLCEQNNRCIWSELASNACYGGPKQEDYYNALWDRYWKIIFRENNNE